MERFLDWNTSFTANVYTVYWKWALTMILVFTCRIPVECGSNYLLDLQLMTIVNFWLVATSASKAKQTRMTVSDFMCPPHTVRLEV